MKNPVSSPLFRCSPFPALLGWLFLAGVVFILAAFPLRASTDEWWHLKSGLYIIEQNYRLPEKDIFSYTSAQYPWENHEWLSHIIMAKIWQWGEGRTLGGWRALILAKAFWLALAYLLLGRFLWQRAGADGKAHLIALFVTLLAAAVGKRMFWARPPVISVTFMIFFLYVLWMHRSGLLKSRWLLVLPVLMPVWANLHGGFLIGGLIVAAYCGGEALEGAGLWLMKKKDAARLKGLQVIRYGFLGLLCGLASLLTPYGYKLYLLSGRVMGDAELVSRLSELQPPRLEFTWAFVGMALLFFAGLLVLLVRQLQGKRPQWPPLGEILLVAFFLQQAASHVRHLLLFGLAGAPLLVWFLREMGKALSPSRKKLGAFLLAALTGGMAGWLVFFPGEAVSVWPYLKEEGRFPPGAQSAMNRTQRLLKGQETEPGAFPVNAVNFILRYRPPGRMYNRNHVCGYLIFALSPEHYRLFTDNRFDIFGGDFLLDELSVANGWPAGLLAPRNLPVRDWRDVVEDWQINWLFLERSELLHQKLVSGKVDGWWRIYQDPQYAIWLKQTPANRKWMEEAGLRPF